VKDNSMSVSEAGRLGGKKRRETADYSEMGAKGGAVTKAKYGMAHYADLGHAGGKATAQKYGREHYVKMGSAGGQRTRELVRKGQAAE
jgi:general stress protein YciG